MNIICTLTRVLPIEQGTSKSSGNAWQKLTIVCQTIEQYPKQVAFTIFGQERINAVSPLLNLGASLKVSFDIDSHEHEGRYFTNVNAWKIEPATQTVQAAPTQGYAPQAPANPYATQPITQMTPPPAVSPFPPQQPQAQQMPPQQPNPAPQQGNGGFPF